VEYFLPFSSGSYSFPFPILTCTCRESNPGRHLRYCVQNSSGAQPALYKMATLGAYPGLKRPWREADYSPPSSVEVKNGWSYNFTLQYVLMAWCL